MKYLAALARYLLAGLFALTCAIFSYATVHYAIHGMGQGVLDAGTGAVITFTIALVVVIDASRDGA